MGEHWGVTPPVLFPNITQKNLKASVLFGIVAFMCYICRNTISDKNDYNGFSTYCNCSNVHRRQTSCRHCCTLCINNTYTLRNTYSQ